MPLRPRTSSRALRCEFGAKMRPMMFLKARPRVNITFWPLPGVSATEFELAPGGAGRRPQRRRARRGLALRANTDVDGDETKGPHREVTVTWLLLAKVFSRRPDRRPRPSSLSAQIRNTSLLGNAAIRTRRFDQVVGSVGRHAVQIDSIATAQPHCRCPRACQRFPSISPLTYRTDRGRARRPCVVRSLPGGTRISPKSRRRVLAAFTAFPS